MRMFAIDVDLEVLRRAEREAEARHTTLQRIVTELVRVMARNWQGSRAGRTPITDSLRGAVKLPGNFREREVLIEELLKKWGLGGETGLCCSFRAFAMRERTQGCAPGLRPGLSCGAPLGLGPKNNAGGRY